MKTFTDRYEIAKLLNFNKYPVLSLDLAKDLKYIISGNEDTHYYKGGKVRFKKRDYLWHGDLCYFKDSGLIVTSDNACITASFGYRDIEESLAVANAPIVKENSEVVVVIYDSKKRLSCVCLTNVGDINEHCSTAISFEGDWEKIIGGLEKAL